MRRIGARATYYLSKFSRPHSHVCSYLTSTFLIIFPANIRGQEGPDDDLLVHERAAETIDVREAVTVYDTGNVGEAHEEREAHEASDVHEARKLREARETREARSAHEATNAHEIDVHEACVASEESEASKEVTIFEDEVRPPQSTQKGFHDHTYSMSPLLPELKKKIVYLQVRNFSKHCIYYFYMIIKNFRTLLPKRLQLKTDSVTQWTVYGRETRS